MPVTAKLSRRFYETLGDEIANELVDWFNQVDATYRADLRELNELNFARFDAKVEQRFALADTQLERRFAEFAAMWERRFARLETQLSELKGELATAQLTQTRWLIGIWAAVALAVLGLYLR
jgi:hypothetical protein